MGQNESITTSIDTATAAAANLVKQTAEATATALNIQYIQRDILEIKQAQKDNAAKLESVVRDFSIKDDQYVRKDDFVFWRNLLVSGLLVSIAIATVLNLIK